MQPSATEWVVNDDYASNGKFKKFAKKHGPEYVSLFNNLDKIVGLLEQGHKVGGFHVNFFKSEGGGVYRIGQTAVPSAKESRLYVFPDQQTQTMFVLTIGLHEGQQTEDIQEAQELVKEIRAKRSPAK